MNDFEQAVIDRLDRLAKDGIAFNVKFDARNLKDVLVQLNEIEALHRQTPTENLRPPSEDEVKLLQQYVHAAVNKRKDATDRIVAEFVKDHNNKMSIHDLHVISWLLASGLVLIVDQPPVELNLCKGGGE